jgi:hypothetical protein
VRRTAAPQHSHNNMAADEWRVTSDEHHDAYCDAVLGWEYLGAKGRQCLDRYHYHTTSLNGIRFGMSYTNSSGFNPYSFFSCLLSYFSTVP